MPSRDHPSACPTMRRVYYSTRENRTLFFIFQQKSNHTPTRNTGKAVSDHENEGECFLSSRRLFLSQQSKCRRYWKKGWKNTFQSLQAAAVAFFLLLWYRLRVRRPSEGHIRSGEGTDDQDDPRYVADSDLAPLC
ncbi:hypothetical protein AVEN_147630-1 [Araneus ventricosus]|uniref:Uncharacterized protein n=1 Tax=Araneus ventricosus TaxID=182803 RepID=A0A4Y2HEJ3_ARAVE|nr:hypothetical protein AVEN_147630-1 [Araneus ventricosus]